MRVAASLDLNTPLMGFEKRRRKIEKDRLKEAALFARIRKLSQEGCDKADRAADEAGRVLVDEYERPMESRAWSA